MVGFTTTSVLGGTGADAATLAPKSAEFIGIPAPDTPAVQATTTVGSSLVVTHSDGSQQTFTLAYQPLFLTGDQVPDGNGGTTLAGGYYDVNGKPIMDPSTEAPTQFFSDCPDGYSLLKLSDASVPATPCSLLCSLNTRRVMPKTPRCIVCSRRRLRCLLSTRIRLPEH